MTTWWYANGDKKIGPVEVDEIKRLLQTGKIGSKTMLWHEGIENWQPLDQVNELNGLKAAVPPPLPPKTEEDPLSYPFATRWPRFFARTFDVWWEMLLVAFVFGSILGRYSAGFVEWINGPGASSLFGILCLPIALSLDASLNWIAGNTPGKYLLGLRVTTSDGKSLRFVQHLSRNFSMWASGLAFGLPLINLFTMASQSRRLGKGQQASYDESSGFQVRSNGSGWVRITIFVCAFAGLLVVMSILNTMEQTAQREAVLKSAMGKNSWENPVTRLTAKIDSTWKHSTKNNSGGQQLYVFSEVADRAMVILGVEQTPSSSLDSYIRAFLKNNATSMRFSDAGRYLEREGRNSWQGSGSMVDGATGRLNVQVVQIGSAYWRVVTIQTLPYEYSDVLVEQLQSALWSTVNFGTETRAVTAPPKEGEVIDGYVFTGGDPSDKKNWTRVEKGHPPKADVSSLKQWERSSDSTSTSIGAKPVWKYSDYDLSGARKAGVSDTEILDHLLANSNLRFNVTGARKEGYSDTEILDHLFSTKSDVVPSRSRVK